LLTDRVNLDLVFYKRSWNHCSKGILSYPNGRWTRLNLFWDLWSGYVRTFGELLRVFIIERVHFWKSCLQAEMLQIYVQLIQVGFQHWKTLQWDFAYQNLQKSVLHKEGVFSTVHFKELVDEFFYRFFSLLFKILEHPIATIAFKLTFVAKEFTQAHNIQRFISN